MKTKFENSPRSKSNAERIKILKEENTDMKRQIEEFDKEAKLYAKKTKMALDKNESLKPEIEQLKEFNKSMQENLEKIAEVSLFGFF
jgi:hypothetical protein